MGKMEIQPITKQTNRLKYKDRKDHIAHLMNIPDPSELEFIYSKSNIGKPDIYTIQGKTIKKYNYRHETFNNVFEIPEFEAEPEPKQIPAHILKKMEKAKRSQWKKKSKAKK